MSSFRTIDTSGYAKVSPPASFGKPARLDWVAIKQLVIDPEYQRDIGKTGRRNILRIAADFDWTKFAPIIVAPAGSDRYAIVDGQHRATAAALVGIERVPCCVIDVARAAQAAAFAAINTVVTAMSPMQVHAAKLAAGDEKAVTLAATCARAGVTICRYPIPANKMKVGETLAAAQLAKFLEKYGETTLVAALSCITRTGDGNVGWVKAPIVEALCAVLDAEPDWRDLPRLLLAMKSLEFSTAFGQACAASPGSRQGTVTALIGIFDDHLERHLTDKPSPAPAPKPAAPQPAPVVKAKPAAAPTPAAAPPAPGRVATFAGISIDFTEDAEALRYRDKRKSISWRQALLFELLARGMPNPIGRDFLRQKLFNGARGEQQDVQLDLVANEARVNAKAVGLDIRETRGIGFSLVKP